MSALFKPAKENMKLIPKDILASVDSSVSEVWDLKLGKIGIVNKMFDPTTYDPNKDNQEGIDPTLVIRWRPKRKSPDSHEDSNELETTLNKELGISKRKISKVESNARIVEWSDGKYQMFIGNEAFDIILQNQPCSKVYAKFEDLLIAKTAINKKALLKPTSFSSKIVHQLRRTANAPNKKVKALELEELVESSIVQKEREHTQNSHKISLPLKPEPQTLVSAKFLEEDKDDDSEEEEQKFIEGSNSEDDSENDRKDNDSDDLF